MGRQRWSRLPPPQDLVQKAGASSQPDDGRKPQKIGKGMRLPFDGLNIDEPMENHEHKQQGGAQMKPFPAGAAQPFFYGLKGSQAECEQDGCRAQPYIIGDACERPIGERWPLIFTGKREQEQAEPALCFRGLGIMDDHQARLTLKKDKHECDMEQTAYAG